MTLFLLGLGAIWLLAGSLWLPVILHPYQIEEYKADRFLLWLVRNPGRWLSRRKTLAWLIGSGLVFMTDTLPEGPSVVPALLAGVSAIVAAWPERPAEVKKPLRWTARARRLGIVTFTLIMIALLLAITLVLAAIPDWKLRVLATHAVGFAIVIAMPVWLMVANLTLYPLEWGLRQVYVRRARRVFQRIDPFVIGITGSYGKTTTKHFLHGILSQRHRVYITPKSYNTVMGICLAINNDLADDYQTEVFVSEMGAYVPGEIARICRLTPPNISIVTAVGPQHLERFGSIANIVKAKYEIVAALPHDGIAIFNWDNVHVREMASRGYPDNRILVSADPGIGVAEGVRFIATDIHETVAGMTFTLADTSTGEHCPVQTSIHGRHNVTNLLLAAATAVAMGMRLADVARAISHLAPADSRLDVRPAAGGITIINDSYSANPDGARSALAVLGLHQTGERLLITPGMVELGPLHDTENHRLGLEAAEVCTRVTLVGPGRTAPIHRGLLDAGFDPERILTVETLSEAVADYQARLKAGDAVLFLNDLPDTY
jgi:UDP-N-acetylmuramoyl-tripeptide--D-alanyl-D-alanine ligase